MKMNIEPVSVNGYHYMVTFPELNDCPYYLENLNQIPDLINYYLEKGNPYYCYGMRYRPAGPGAQPKDFDHLKESKDKKYYDIVVYRRELTPEEVTQYELEYIGRKKEK